MARREGGANGGNKTLLVESGSRENSYLRGKVVVVVCGGDGGASNIVNITGKDWLLSAIWQMVP